MKLQQIQHEAKEKHVASCLDPGEIIGVLAQPAVPASSLDPAQPPGAPANYLGPGQIPAVLAQPDAPIKNEPF